MVLPEGKAGSYLIIFMVLLITYIHGISSSVLPESEHEEKHIEHQRCSSNTNCSANEYCSSTKVCECKIGFHRNFLTKECVECIFHSDCDFKGMCTLSGVCTYNSSFPENTPNIWKPSGKVCVSSSDCGSGAEFCNSNHLCECKSGFHRSVIFKECIDYGKCNVLLDCKANEFCSEFSCVCERRYFRDKATDTCLEYKLCKTNQDCDENEQCILGKCECKPGYSRDTLVATLTNNCEWSEPYFPPDFLPPNNKPNKTTLGVAVIAAIFILSIKVAIIVGIRRSLRRCAQRSEPQLIS